MKVYVVYFLNCCDGVKYWDIEKIMRSGEAAKQYCDKMNMISWTEYCYEEHEVE